MFNQKYEMFRDKGIICVSCGIEGKFFALEKPSSHRASKRYHFNLYAVNEKGKEVMMTKDHIIPRSKRGRNHISNYQPMCEICNSIKGDYVPFKLYYKLLCAKFNYYTRKFKQFIRKIN